MKYYHKQNKQLHVIIGNTGRDIIVANCVTGALFTVFITDFNNLFTIDAGMVFESPLSKTVAPKYKCAKCGNNEVGAPEYYCMDCFIQSPENL